MTAFKPASNGLGRRFIRQIKMAVRSCELPSVLRGIRSYLNADIQCVAAECVG